MDFNELEKTAKYTGYTANSPYIQDLWRILHGLEDDNKRKFLAFVTGSDRVPVGGLSKLHLAINENGGDWLE